MTLAVAEALNPNKPNQTKVGDGVKGVERIKGCHITLYNLSDI